MRPPTRDPPRRGLEDVQEAVFTTRPVRFIILLIFHSCGQNGLCILQHQVDKWRFPFFTSDRPKENKKASVALSLLVRYVSI